MDQQKVDMYLIANQKYFPSEKTAYLRGRLLRHTDHYRLVYRIGQNERTEFKQCPAAFVRKTFLSATRFTCFWRRFGALFPIKRIFTA